MSKYVIVGASAAGIGAVEAIRDVDPAGSITVISEEQIPQYSRPMISDLVSGKTTFDKMKCRSDNFWEDHRVQTLTGETAVRLDFAEKTVELNNGSKVNFEKILLATGGKPFIPKIEGAEKEGVFTFTTLSDAEQLATKIQNAKRVVVIGAGLIGISVTEALTKLGLQVTMVELKEKILSLLLDETAAEIVEKAIRKAGVTIIAGQTVKRILGKTKNDNTVSSAVLTNGNSVECDIVIIAIGVVPRMELVAGTDVKTNRGIIVDRHMRTSVPNVYASGDVAEAYDFILNKNRSLPLWPLAQIEGKIAGYNMAGKETEYEGGTSMSSLKYFGVPITSIGIANPKDNKTYEILTKHDPSKNVYKKIVLKNNIIVGICFVNDIERTGILFHLMKNSINVRRFKQGLLSDDFSLATLPLAVIKKVYPGETR